MQEKPLFRWAAETSACLAYGPDDLPKMPCDLAFHAHLPLDLSWETESARDAEEAGKKNARICLRLFARIAHLAPWCVVLHPPKDMETAQAMLTAFFGVWRAACACPVLLENTRWCDTALLADSCLEPTNHGADGLCLDLGHLMRYHQTDLLEPRVLAKTAMVHWNLADQKGRHLPLTAMKKEDEHLFFHVMEHVPATCLHVLEIFDWQGVAKSLPIVQDLWSRVHGVPA